MRKKCSSCQQEKDTSCFYKTKSNPDGYFGYCINCHKEKSKKRYYERSNEDRNSQMRKYRENTGNAANKKYYRTLRGHVVRTYRQMFCRVTDKKHYPLYFGLPILSKKEFYDFSFSFPGIEEMHNAYVASGYDKRLCPSIDRIVPKLGYIIGNIRWVTFSVNTAQASITTPRGINMLGVRLGSLVVDKYIGVRGVNGRLWGYTCDCGKSGEILTNVLMRKKNHHCGCKTTPAVKSQVPDWGSLPRVSFLNFGKE